MRPRRYHATFFCTSTTKTNPLVSKAVSSFIFTEGKIGTMRIGIIISIEFVPIPAKRGKFWKELKQTSGFFMEERGKRI